MIGTTTPERYIPAMNELEAIVADMALSQGDDGFPEWVAGERVQRWAQRLQAIIEKVPTAWATEYNGEVQLMTYDAAMKQAEAFKEDGLELKVFPVFSGIEISS